ncbi:MAG: SDR family NAD(P)-dependent oxidoreductase [Candidatus Limnocylindrales bacterium]
MRRADAQGSRLTVWGEARMMAGMSSGDAALPQPDPRERIRGRVAIVTGASSGIGRATALALGAAGAAVVGGARREVELATLARELEAMGAPALVVPADVTDQEAMERLVGAALERFGRIDILVTSAGVYVRQPLASLSTADLERSLDVNFYGAVRPTLAVLPHFLERRSGHLVFVSSMISRKGLPAEAPYAAAKWALTGFADVARQELRPMGISVSTILPGRVATAFIEGVRFHPISRPIPATDVADAILGALRHRRAEVMLPRRARGIHYAAAISPRLADWVVRRFRLQGWRDDGRAPGDGSVRAPDRDRAPETGEP